MSNLEQGGLPPIVSGKCADQISHGYHDDAVLTALKALETHLAWASGDARLYGAKAVDAALAPGKGTLRLQHDQEQRSMHSLVAGLMGVFRNPAAHGFPGFSRKEASAVVDLVDSILLRLAHGRVDRVRRALGAGVPFDDLYVFAVADLDGDKRAETVAGILDAEGVLQRVLVLKPAVDGYVVRTVQEDSRYVFCVEARDVDLDGRCELLVYGGAGGPGAWLEVFRWSQDAIVSLGRIAGDLVRFAWAQPNGDGSFEVDVSSRDLGEDLEWRCLRRTFGWSEGKLVEVSRRIEPWADSEQ